MHSRSGLSAFLFALILGCVATTGQAKVNFRTVPDVAVTAPDAGPQAIALGDFNRDKYSDLVVVSPEDDVVVLLNDGTGKFVDELDNSGADGPVAVVVADFNRDGRLDVATANRDSGTVTVLIQVVEEGNVSLQEDADADQIDVDAGPIGLVAVDLDKDMRLDLVVLSDNTIHLLKGNGLGGFADYPTASVSLGSGVNGGFAIASGDFDDDGNVDIAVSARGSDRLSVLLGKGDGTFNAARIQRPGQEPGGLVVGNFRGDLKDDIAVVTGVDVDATVTLLESTGGGSFRIANTDNVEAGSVAIAKADLDGDQKDDLIVTAADGQPGVLCRQPSDGCYEPGNDRIPAPQAFPDDDGFQLQFVSATISGSGVAIVTGDLNNDNQPDFVRLSSNGDSVRISLNSGNVAPPTETPTMGGTVVATVSPTPTGPTPTPTRTATPIPTTTPTPIPTAPYTECNTSQAGQPNIGGKLVGVAAGDFDRDGNLDIAVADNTGNRVVLLLTEIASGGNTACDVLGLHSGTATISVSAPVAIASGDFDIDGKVDLAVLGSAGLGVFYGNGAGGFIPAAANPMPTAGGLGKLAIADFNRDGSPDIIVATQSSNNVLVFLRSSATPRQFDASCSVLVGRTSNALLAQDLNLDGRPDFAAASVLTNDFSVFQQRGADVTPGPSVCPAGTSGFRGLTPFSLGAEAEPQAMVAGRFEQGDTVPDIAVVLRSSGTSDGRLLTVLGRAAAGGDVTYQSGRDLQVPRPEDGATASLPSAVGTGDVNRDGRADLVVADVSNSTVVVFLAKSDGSFEQMPVPLILDGIRPVDLLVIDIDGDNRPDVVTANEGTGTNGSVSILLSSRPPPTPTPLPTPPPTITGTATATPSETPEFTATPTATPTVTTTPSRTRSVTPTGTVVPTKTLKPGTFSLSGSSCSISSSENGGSLWLLGAAGLLLVRLRRGGRH
jgi:hypothetical protein